MNGRRDEQLREARRLLGEARDDLEWAAVGGKDPTLAPRVACFLAHLAVEKALKSLLVAEGTPPKRIHGLIELRSGLSPAVAEAIAVAELADLEPWNVAGRYASDASEADAKLAARLVEYATRIVSVAESTVSAMEQS
jgi:HEPN domain-containing protein